MHNNIISHYSVLQNMFTVSDDNISHPFINFVVINFLYSIHTHKFFQFGQQVMSNIFLLNHMKVINIHFYLHRSM